MEFLDGDNINDLPDAVFLIDGILPDGEVSLLYGYSSHGKSFVALDLAMCVSTGNPWHGYKVGKTGTVVYVAAEGMRGFKHRKLAWERTYSRSIRVTTAFQMPKTAVQLLDPDSVDDFIQSMNSLPKPIALVVIDTLSRCMVAGAKGGAETDENNNTDMNRALGAAVRIRDAAKGAAILFIHHPNANGKPRGGTALPSGVEMQMKLSILGEGKKIRKAGPGDRVQLVCEKQKDSEEFSPITFTLEKVTLGGGKSSLILRSADDAEVEGNTMAYKTGPRHKMSRISDDAVLAVVREHGSEGIGPAAISRALGIDPKKKIVNNHLKTLKDEGRIKPLGTGKYVAVDVVTDAA